MEDYSVTDESKQGIQHTNSYVNLGDQENNYTEISSNCKHESSNENNYLTKNNMH